jgi:hypothetical protein
VEKESLSNSRNLALPTAHKERNFGFAMTGFLIIVKRFRSTTGDKVTCDFLHCNSFFSVSTRVMKPLWPMGFKAVVVQKLSKIAALESVAKSEKF